MEQIPKSDYQPFYNKYKKHDNRYDAYYNTVNYFPAAFFLTLLTHSHANLEEIEFFDIQGKYCCKIARVLGNTFVPQEKYDFIKFKEQG